MAMSNVFGEAILDGETRSIRTIPIDVVDVSAQSGSVVGLGMMVGIVAKKGTGIVNRLRVLLEKGQGGAAEAKEILTKKIDRGLWTTSREYVDRLVNEPVYAEIRYAGESLHKGLFVPQGLDVVSTVFPYNGGRLAPEGFSLVERFRGGTTDELEALIVRSAPELTEAEKVALHNVPPDQLVNNVGPASWCDTTWWAAAGYAIAAGFAAAAVAVGTTLVLDGKRAPDWNDHLSDKEIEKLGPAASARSLLALRRKLIEKNISAITNEEK